MSLHSWKKHLHSNQNSEASFQDRGMGFAPFERRVQELKSLWKTFLKITLNFELYHLKKKTTEKAVKTWNFSKNQTFRVQFWGGRNLARGMKFFTVVENILKLFCAKFD